MRTAQQPHPTAPRSRRAIIVLVVAAFILAACGTDRQPDSLVWRNIHVDLPDEWYVFEEADDRLSISNVDLAAYAQEQAVPDRDDVVAMFFTYEPSTLPADWRALLDRLDADIEVDDRLELNGEVPATRMIFRYDSAGVPTREMVVLIPSRAVVVLAQPVPRPGQLGAPELFLDHIDTFMDVIEQAELGRPLLDD